MAKVLLNFTIKQGTGKVKPDSVYVLKKINRSSKSYEKKKKINF